MFALKGHKVLVMAKNEKFDSIQLIISFQKNMLSLTIVHTLFRNEYDGNDGGGGGVDGDDV